MDNPQSDQTAQPNISKSLDSSRLLSLINSMSDGVIAVDNDYRVVTYNAASLNILDSNTTIKGMQLRQVLKIYNQSSEPVDIEMLLANTKIPTSSRSYLLYYNDDSKANLYLSIAPVHQSYGETGAEGYVLVMRDITKEKSLEEERDEFISVVSHELRNPLTIAEGGISNAKFMLNKTHDISQIGQALDSAHRQILFLAELINDLATLSRAERAKLTLEVNAINVHDMIQDLVNSYRSDATSKGLQLVAEVDPHVEFVQSSELYVHEILQNFVTNAIKYTANGSVTIGAKQLPDGVELSVRDTGFGISEEDQKKIFQKFFRSPDSRLKDTKGTGLGLYITKKLASLIKGTLKVESQISVGSTFSIDVPNLTATK